MIELTRRYRFSAAHMLCHASFTPEENRRVYGKCANPSGHGHNYGLEVTVAGPVDERSGELMSRERLDAVVEQRVLHRFGHRMLNDDELFRDRVPTAENLAGAIFARLEGAIAQAGSARLRRVRLLETRRSAFVCGEMR
jgi:6-pyruvoyltetrahydropterin/6-carboxytetrahydropterin synthase